MERVKEKFTSVKNKIFSSSNRDAVVRLMEKNFNVTAAIISLFTAAVFLSICSKCSFFYPMQDWVDVNCFYTVGKSMSHGIVLYRDIFEQKGPILYFLYNIFGGMTENSFLGIYFLEVLTFGAFLFSAFKCITLLTEKRYAALAALPFLALLITTSRAFSHGASVEELTLFCLAFSLYCFLKTSRTGIAHKGLYFAMGLAIGFIFWIKFTILGLYIGAFICMIVFAFRTKNMKFLRDMIIFAILGFVVMTIPVVIYFAVNNALGDLWYTYFYNNIFVYSNKSSFFERIFKLLFSTGKTLLINFGYSILLILGIVWAAMKKNFESWLLCSSAATACAGLFIGGQAYIYYGLPLAVFAIFGICALMELAQRFGITERRRLLSGILAAAIVLSPLLSYFLSGNTYLMRYEKSELPQYRFAAIINETEDATLYNCGFLDGGFYFASDTVPSTRYFCKLNFTSEEMDNDARACVEEGKTDFIVTRDSTLDEMYGDCDYTLVDDMAFPFEGKDRHYYLYKRNY